MLNFNRNLTTIKNLTTHVLYTEMRIGCEWSKIKMNKMTGQGRQSNKPERPSGLLWRSLILAVPDVKAILVKN